MKYESTITLTKEELDKFLLLQGMSGSESYNMYGLCRNESLIKTVTFPNGNFVDIKLNIGDEDEPNWTEAVLFNKEGQQIAYTEPEDTFTGEWYLTSDMDEYVVTVK